MKDGHTPRRNLLIVAAVLLAVLVVTPFSSSYAIVLVTHALIFAILAMSLDILLGYTGLPSLGQAAYLGMGAYLTAILATRFQFGLDWTFWLVVVMGMLIGRRRRCRLFGRPRGPGRVYS